MCRAVTIGCWLSQASVGTPPSTPPLVVPVDMSDVSPPTAEEELPTATAPNPSSLFTTKSRRLRSAAAARVPVTGAGKSPSTGGDATGARASLVFDPKHFQLSFDALLLDGHDDIMTAATTTMVTSPTHKQAAEHGKKRVAVHHGTHSRALTKGANVDGDAATLQHQQQSQQQQQHKQQQHKQQQQQQQHQVPPQARGSVSPTRLRIERQVDASPGTTPDQL